MNQSSGAGSERRPITNTVSVAVPGSMVDNDRKEIRTTIAGQLARFFGLFEIDEVVIYDDKPGDVKWGDPSLFLARVCQYAETPPYIRKVCIPRHQDLQMAGLLSPLEAPHHAKLNDQLPYREGVTLDKPPGTRPGGNGTGSFVDVGLKTNVLIDRPLKPGMRVTVRMPSYDKAGRSYLLGEAVPPNRPRSELGVYWGFQTRHAPSLKAVFSGCPFGDAYDYKVGVSEKASLSIDDRKKFKAFPSFKHLLVVFGPSGGIEECVEADEDLAMSGNQAHKLFNAFLRTTPTGGSRFVRPEEALFISLSKIGPLLERENAAS